LVFVLGMCGHRRHGLVRAYHDNCRAVLTDCYGTVRKYIFCRRSLIGLDGNTRFNNRVSPVLFGSSRIMFLGCFLIVCIFILSHCTVCCSRHAVPFAHETWPQPTTTHESGALCHLENDRQIWQKSPDSYSVCPPRLYKARRGSPAASSESDCSIANDGTAESAFSAESTRFVVVVETSS
jgi:hypothetical protein